MRGNPKFQKRNPKEIQIPKSKNRMTQRTARSPFGALIVGASLELGTWDLELSAVIE
jgi:hypothetical protein